MTNCQAKTMTCDQSKQCFTGQCPRPVIIDSFCQFHAELVKLDASGVETIQTAPIDDTVPLNEEIKWIKQSIDFEDLSNRFMTLLEKLQGLLGTILEQKTIGNMQKEVLTQKLRGLEEEKRNIEQQIQMQAVYGFGVTGDLAAARQATTEQIASAKDQISEKDKEIEALTIQADVCAQLIEEYQRQVESTLSVSSEKMRQVMEKAA